MMSIKERVAAALDAPKVERTDLVDVIEINDPFRAFLAAYRLEQSSRGRTAHRVLLLGTGAKPCRRGVRELVRLDLRWIAEKWCALYQEVTGDSSITLADLMPSETELAKLVPSTAPKKPAQKFVGVQVTPLGKFQAVIYINDKSRYLGTYEDGYAAALRYNEEAKKHPLASGRPRKLNFFVDDPLKRTPEPVTRIFSLREAA